jgi:Gpi18-like mannosyltransferase
MPVIMNNYPIIQMFRQRLAHIPWKMVQSVLLAFILTRTMVFIVTYISMIELPVQEGDIYWRAIPQNILADGLVRWDSGFYRDIISSGYQSVSEGRATVFFPLYPALVWLLSRMIGHIYLSGLLISNVMFLIALFYLYALVQREYDEDTAGRAVFYLAAAPAAFFFSAMYTESTFLAFLTASFYYARNRRWALAALAGAAASATRSTGVVVAIFFILEGLWQQGVRFLPVIWNIKAQIELLRKDVRLAQGALPSVLAAIGSVTGFVVYMVYLKLVFRDALAFIHNQSYWGRHVAGNWLLTLIVNTYHRLNLSGDFWTGQINFNVLQDVIAVIVFIPLVVAVIIKMRPSFAIFTLISFLLPLMSSSIISMRRYVLVLVPCYIILAIWGQRLWVDRVILAVSLPLQAYLTILFSHWYFAG